MPTIEAQDPYTPTQDERTLACISHLAIFVSTIGFLLVIGLWIYARNRFPYASFQAAQAALYQLFVMVLTFIAVLGFLAVFFGAFGIGFAGGLSPDGTAFAILFVAMLIAVIGIASILAIALYIYAIVAAVRSYQGQAFRIPGIAQIADTISPMPLLTRRESR